MRFFIFISAVQSILFLGHWFFYRTLVCFLGWIGSPKLLRLRVAIGLLSVSFVLTSLLAFRYSNLPVRCLYTAAATWVGILYLFILASILSWFLYALAKLLRFPLDRRVLIEVLIVVALSASLHGIINSGVIRITRLNLQVPGLPGPWKGKTAVWVSDTHLGQIRNFGFARRIANLVQSLHPDIVFIGGDLFDGVSVDPDRIIEPFSRLSTRYGTYFVSGNHEEFSDRTRYLRAIQRNGMRILNNEKVEIDGLQIIGVNYGDSRPEEQFRAILQKIGIDPSKPSILLKHTPFHLQVAKDQGISVQLSGHTHQGQVFLFRFITHRVYQGYDYGLRRLGDLLVYTSSGAGTWGPPMRLDTKPEIVAITFQ
jgi:uncharacterized protein